MNFWLMKSEPEVYSIDNLFKDKFTLWEGVRNYQARNFMMNSMAVGDLVLFYHSNANPSGIAGLAKVSRTKLIDQTQFNSKSEYFDPKAGVDHPRWFCVEVEYLLKLKSVITLDDLRAHTSLLKMGVLQKGQRLSVMPVALNEFEYIYKNWISPTKSRDNFDSLNI